MTTVYPLEHLKSNQTFYVSAQRTDTGEYLVVGQLTAEQYLSLDGKKINTESGKLTFKRWTKITQTSTYNDGSENQGQPYEHQIDRVYISLGYTSKYGYAQAKLGYIEATEWTGMIADENGNSGAILCKTERMSKELAEEIIKAIS